VTQADDQYLAQPPMETRPPPHRVDVIEPRFRQGRIVRQYLVYIYDGSPPPFADLFSEVVERRIVFGLDQGYAGHGAFALLECFRAKLNHLTGMILPQG
jgi:hypothetical protein